MADNWSIHYREHNIGPAVHGVIEVRDPNAKIVKSYEGLATRPDGSNSRLGSELAGDSLKGYYYNNKSDNAESTPIPVFSGSESEVKARMAAMQEATDQINSQNIPYQLPGPGSTVSALTFGKGTNTNSNSHIKTLFKVLGKDVPDSPYYTPLGQEGGGTSLLTDQQIKDIASKYGPNFDTLPTGTPDPLQKEVPTGSFAPPKPNTSSLLGPSSDDAYDYSQPPAETSGSTLLTANNDNLSLGDQTPVTDQQALSQFTSDVGSGDGAPYMAAPIAIATDAPSVPTLLTTDQLNVA